MAADVRPQYRFETALTAEKHRGALIQHHKSRALPLLTKYFRVGDLGAGGHAPINGTHIVSRLVATHLFKLHAATTKARAYTAAELAAGRGASGEAQVPGGKAKLKQAAQVGACGAGRKFHAGAGHSRQGGRSATVCRSPDPG